MIYYIKENQLKTNLKKYGFQTYDKDVLGEINQLHRKVVSGLLQQHKKYQKKTQMGGRVSFPIDYFGGTTNNLTNTIPTFTNISGNDVMIRQEMTLHDPSQVLGTEKGMVSALVGGAQKFSLSQTASHDVVKALSKQEDVALDDKHRFVQISKQKFENVIDEVLKKTKKQNQQGHLSKDSLVKVLEQKKYKSFKA